MEPLTPDLIRAAVVDHQATALRSLVHHLAPILRARITMTLVRCGGHMRGDIQAQVDDFVQEVLVRLFADDGERLLAWDPDRGSASVWFGLIAQRVTLDLMRVKRTNPYFEKPTEADELGAGAGLTRDLNEQILDRDLLLRLGNRLRDGLSDRDRLLFELSIVAGEDDERVRSLLGLGRDALYQARRRLRLRLESVRKEFFAHPPPNQLEPSS